MLTACNDRRDPPDFVIPETTSTAGPDLGIIDGGIRDRPVPSLCVPGRRRCLGENSPLFEACAASGEQFERESCASGQVCRQGQCLEFSCVADRAICLGTDTTATCDSTGEGFVDLQPCPEDTVCRGGACIDTCAAAEATDSYLGCSYVARRLENIATDGQFDNSPWGIVVANPEPFLDVVVSVTSASQESAEIIESVAVRSPRASTPDRTVRSEVLLSNGGTIPIDDPRDVRLPPLSAAVFLMGSGDQFNVRSNRPVVASQYSPYCCNYTYSNDASLLLPTYTWGRRYRVVNYPSWTSPTSGVRIAPYVDLVTGEEAATVRWVSPAPIVSDGGPAPSRLDIPANSTRRLQVDPQETEAIDLSGMEITSDVEIAVFAGHPCTFIPADKWACDHLEEQLLPADTLGNRYMLVPTRRRGDPGRDENEATYFRLVADEDLTIETSPPFAEIRALPASARYTASCQELFEDGVLRLSEGESCEFGTNQPLGLESTGRLIVGGFISGHESTGLGGFGRKAGDPSMFILPPIEQFRRSYSFVSPPTYASPYVTIVADPDAPVVLDGRNIQRKNRLERRLVELGNQSWEVFNVAVESGVHRLESEAPFGIVVYAYDDYVSYAFTGGLDLVPKGVQR